MGLPRALPLELYVLPSSGGQEIMITLFYYRRSSGHNATSRCHNNVNIMELRGVEPLASAVRLQRSTS